MRIGPSSWKNTESDTSPRAEPFLQGGPADAARRPPLPCLFDGIEYLGAKDESPLAKGASGWGLITSFGAAHEIWGGVGDPEFLSLGFRFGARRGGTSYSGTPGDISEVPPSVAHRQNHRSGRVIHVYPNQDR